MRSLSQLDSRLRKVEKWREQRMGRRKLHGRLYYANFSCQFIENGTWSHLAGNASDGEVKTNPVGILGATPESRDLAAEEGFRRAIWALNAS